MANRPNRNDNSAPVMADHEIHEWPPDETRNKNIWNETTQDLLYVWSVPLEQRIVIRNRKNIRKK